MFLKLSTNIIIDLESILEIDAIVTMTGLLILKLAINEKMLLVKKLKLMFRKLMSS